MCERPKILFLLLNDEYVRNYLETNALAELQNRYEVSIAASELIERKKEIAALSEFIGFVSTEAGQANILRTLFQIYAWRHRSKSKTFFYRWLRWTGWENISKGQGLATFAKTFCAWFFRNLAASNGFRIPVLASSLLFPVTILNLKRQLKQNRILFNLLKTGDYSAVIFPSSAYEPLGVEIIRTSRELKIPSICLIDNWDNLTSKTVFWEKPSMLGVWGEQTKRQAIEIHGFTPDSVVPIGSPRFERYFDRENLMNATQSQERPYVLFVGSAMPFDEISALRMLEDNLEILDPAGRLKIIYRPHPQQQKRRTPSLFESAEFTRVQLDDQFLEAAGRGMKVPGTASSELAGNSFQPSLDRYPALLGGAQLVIGPLTTMLLEASLCLRPVLGLAYSDALHFTTSLKYFSHFDGMEKVPGFTFCFSQSELRDSLSQALENGAIDESESDRQTKYFVFRSATPYSKRVANLVSSAINQSEL